MHKKQCLVLLTLIILLNACAVGPDYVRPGAAVPAKFKEAKGKAFILPKKKGWKTALPRDDFNRGEWWKIFNDPDLNALEAQLNCYNQTIATALANYMQSRAIVNEARSGFFPSLVGLYNMQRQKQGAGTTLITTATPAGTSTGAATTGAVGSGKAATRTSFTEVLDANWEPDIWGLVRRTVEADSSLAQSNQALLAVTRLSAQGALAQYYFELRALDRDQDLLNKTVVSYQKALQFTLNQYRSGVAARSDVVQAQGQLEVSKAQSIDTGIFRGQYEHAIAVLIGRPPANFTMPFKPLKAKPPEIPVNIPTAWLERRPDVAQAERLMQQTNAQIGIALMAYYPNINLSATGSGGGISLPQLIQSPIIGWALGFQVAQMMFDGGLRNATVSAARSAYLAQVATYRQTILAAFQDVEDNLLALRLLKKEGVQQNKAAASAVEALRLVMNQYKAGTLDYSSVITSQISAYTAQKNAYDIVGLQMTTAAALVKALGGGWCTSDIDFALVQPGKHPN